MLRVIAAHAGRPGKYHGGFLVTGGSDFGPGQEEILFLNEVDTAVQAWGQANRLARLIRGDEPMPADMHGKTSVQIYRGSLAHRTHRRVRT